MADEKLIIDVSVRDELTPALQKADKAVGNFATTAKAGFDRVDDSASKLSAGVSNAGASIDATKKKAIDFADVAQKKFEALGKAAIGIFAADVVAKVAGFSSALDLVSKAAEAAAEALRDALGITAYEEKLIREQEVLKQTAAGWDALRRAREAAEQASRGPGIDIPALRLGTGSLTIPQNFISTQGLSPDQEAQVIGRADSLRVLVEALAAEGRQRLSFTKDPRTGAVSRAEDPVAVTDDLRNRLQSAAREVEIFAENLRFSNYIAEREAEIQRGIQQQALQRLRTGEQFGPPAPEFFEIPRGFEFIPSGSGGSGSSRGSGSTFSAEFNAANARRRAVAGRVAQNRRREQSQFLPLEFTEAVQQTQQIASFAEQAAQSFDNLGNAIRSSIGDQVVLGSFNALSNFFAQAIQGQATLRDLGRSFVQLGAQILAQQAALRVLGFFGFGGAAAGAGVGAAGGAGVAAGGAAGSISLGSGGFSTLGIQGGGQSFAASRGAGIQVSLSVTSLDPRGAADVVLSQMPVIQRALASSISNGSSRALRVAVGNA